MASGTDVRFEAHRLNDGDQGWAVVGVPSGAIVITADGRLMIRLSRAGAEEAARALNEASDRGEHPPLNR